MRQVHALIQGPLLLLAIAYITMGSYANTVQNREADPDRSGSVERTPSRTSIVEGKLSYDATQQLDGIYIYIYKS